MRDYWLGRLTEAEADNCELEWFSGDADALLLESVRDDLIDEFLAEGLSAGDKLLFEQNFLTVPINLRDVAVAQVYRRTIDTQKVESFLAPAVASAETTSIESKKGFWQTLFAPLNLGFAALALLIVAGTFAVWESGRNLPGEIAKTNVNIRQPSLETIPIPATTMTTTTEPMPTITNTNAVKPSPEKSPTPKIEISPKPPASFNPIQILALATAVRSGGGQKPSIKLKKTTSTLRLTIPIPGRDETYQSFNAKIVSETDGQMIWQNKLPDLNDKPPGKEISVAVPTKKLAAGGYKLVLTGERSDGTSKELRAAFFDVQKD